MKQESLRLEVMTKQPACQDGNAALRPREAMLRMHFLQLWFGLADQRAEEPVLEMPTYREFALLPEGLAPLPDKSTIAHSRHLLEKGAFAAQLFAADNATLSANGLTLRSTRCSSRRRVRRRTSIGTRGQPMHNSRRYVG
jgi:IS5 family transposase